MVRTSKITITHHVRKEDLERQMHDTDNIRVYEHLLAIKLAYDGKTPNEIASILSKSIQIVYIWLNAWNEEGWQGIMPRFGGGRPAELNKKELEELYETVTTKKPCNLMDTDDVFWDIELVREYALKRFGANYTYSGMWKIVREKFKLNLIKPYSKDYRKPDDAEEILKRRIDELSEIISQESTIVGFLDESSVQNKPHVKRVLTENDRVVCDTSYNPSQRFTCMGFLETNGDLFTFNSPKSKKEDFKIFLENLRLKYDSENTIVAFSDNAKIHKAKIIKEYCSQNKIISVFLPPYSPQLNPIETLWRLLKKKLASRVFKTIQDLYVSSENILKSFGNLESLCSNWVTKFLA
jgi:transposase